MSDNNNGYRGPARKKNALDNRKLRLTAKNAEGRQATLGVTLVNNNPRITVYPNLQGDTQPVQAKFDLPGFEALLVLLERAIAFKPGTEAEFRKKAVTMRPNFKGQGQRPDGVVTDAECWVGKDKEGCIWICVNQYQKPAIKFIIINNEYLQFRHSTDEQFSVADASELYATAWVRMLSRLLSNVAVTEFVEEKPRDQQGGNNNRGGGNGGGYGQRSSGGGYDRRSQSSDTATADVDEDALPF